MSSCFYNSAPRGLGQGVEASSLILVSMETIVREDFVFYLRNLIEDGKLDRIIVDECHLLLSSLSYRSIMYRFIEILLLPIQYGN
jgi:superfamily II DNA or RNA helicase